MRFKRNLRASDRIDSNDSVEKFWNSSTKRQKSLRSFSGIFTRLMAAVWNFITKIIPRSFELSSPSLPFERFTSKIFWSSITWRISNEDLVWPKMLRIIVLEMNGDHFDENQVTTSPASLDFCEAGNSLVQ